MSISTASRRSFPALLWVTVSWCLASAPGGATASTVVPVPAFQSIELRGGGEVILKHGPSQRVTLLEGAADLSRVAVDDRGRLVIERCPGECPRGYRMKVEVVVPEMNAISVADGGTIRSDRGFPRQHQLALAVQSGGTIDLRSMAADAVAASVHHGGQILTKPLGSLAASIDQGGVITYWGTPSVSQSVTHGGVVARGRAADADKPLRELGVPRRDVPAVPPAPRRRTI